MTGNKIFQKVLALGFLKGFNTRTAHSSIMASPITQAIRASKRRPMMNAEPEKALPGGLNFQNMISREMVSTISNSNTTEKIHLNNLGIRSKNNMHNYLKWTKLV